MARFLNDTNKIVLIHESGTYASTSGTGNWIGQVLSNELTDTENKIENRFLGALTRSFDNFQLGPRDVTGTLSLRPQDFRLAFYAIGSVNTGSVSAAMTHVATEVNTSTRLSAFTSGVYNPPFSFTLEDSKQSPGAGNNFIRTINGIIPNLVTINANQGEIISVDAEYIAQTVTFGSGTTTSVTENISNRPYLFDDTTLTMAGSAITSAKSVVFEINNNLIAPHYLNGSREVAVPFYGNKDYTLTVTADMGNELDWLYKQYYQTGSIFNTTLDFNADLTTAIGTVTAGSQHAIFAMSGCVVTNFTLPSAEEDVSTVEMEIRAKNVSATEYQKNVVFNPF